MEMLILPPPDVCVCAGGWTTPCVGDAATALAAWPRCCSGVVCVQRWVADEPTVRVHSMCLPCVCACCMHAFVTTTKCLICCEKKKGNNTHTGCLFLLVELLFVDLPASPAFCFLHVLCVPGALCFPRVQALPTANLCVAVVCLCYYVLVSASTAWCVTRLS